MTRRYAFQDQMRYGTIWSVIVHVVLIGLVAIQWPQMNFDQQQQAVQVKIVSVEKDDAKPLPKDVKKPEAVYSQQSAAPAKPPEVQPVKKVEAPKVAKVESKKVPPQPKPKPKVQPAAKAQQKRPEKLDKSKDKKPVLKDENAKPKPKSNDDFLKALSFIEDLKEKPNTEDTPAEQAGEENAPMLLADIEAQNRIKKHISSNWLKPSGMVDEPPIAIEIKINRDGTLKNVRVITSSGKPFFDNSLLRAVRKSEPIPYPADQYNKFKVMEIIWNG